MPNVNGVSYPYTPAGQQAASQARSRQVQVPGNARSAIGAPAPRPAASPPSPAPAPRQSPAPQAIAAPQRPAPRQPAAPPRPAPASRQGPQAVPGMAAKHNRPMPPRAGRAQPASGASNMQRANREATLENIRKAYRGNRPGPLRRRSRRHRNRTA